jgi:2-polyprenyl-3-methyl-5-hydroxy-6-metoxy-1,4-benzoquinol methylase
MSKIYYGKKTSKKAKDAYNKVKYRTPAKTFPSTFSDAFVRDPKWINFHFSRYKFVSKMLVGYKNVLEIGCWGGTTSLVVAQVVKQLTAVDFFKKHIDEAKKYTQPLAKNIKFLGHDIIDSPVKKNYFDAAYAIDVLDHIDPKQENQFMKNIVKSISKDGVLILGAPSKESQKYASEGAKKSHLNCKTGIELYNFGKKYFKNIFIFGMNDEVIHTGFLPMCNYLFILCSGKK